MSRLQILQLLGIAFCFIEFYLHFFRAESRSRQLSLEDKEYELQKTRDDLEGLKGVVEYNLGCMEAEKR